MTTENYRNATGTQCPPLFTSVDGTYQVGVLIKLNYHLLVFKRSLVTGQITSTYDLETDAVALANGITPVNPVEDSNSSHYGAACALDDQNRMYIVGNSLANTSSPHMIRAAAGSISSWTSIAWPPPGVLSTGGGGTYNIFNRLPDGRLIYHVDQREAGGAAEGKDNFAYILPLGSSTWSPLVPGHYFAKSDAVGAPNRIYVGGSTVDLRPDLPHGYRMYVWGSFRDDWTQPTTSRQLWLIYSDNCTDSTSWKQPDGTSQTMPLTAANCGWQAAPGTGSGAIMPMTPGTYSSFGSGTLAAFNKQPHVITRNDSSSTVWIHRWHDGASWQQETTNAAALAPAGTLAPSIFAMKDGVAMYFTYGGRILVSSILAGGFSIKHGTAIDSQTIIPFPDPIQQQKGILHLLVADGDTPKVWELGGNYCAVAA